MKVTDSEPARDYTKPHLITEEDSKPYYCPDCGRCLGYSYKSFQIHIGRYTRHCKEKFAGIRLYACKYCNEEFHELHHLAKHYKTFGDACKTRQITMNLNNFSFNCSKSFTYIFIHKYCYVCPVLTVFTMLYMVDNGLLVFYSIY